MCTLRAWKAEYSVVEHANTIGKADGGHHSDSAWLTISSALICGFSGARLGHKAFLSIARLPAKAFRTWPRAPRRAATFYTISWLGSGSVRIFRVLTVKQSVT